MGVLPKMLQILKDLAGDFGANRPKQAAHVVWFTARRVAKPAV